MYKNKQLKIIDMPQLSKSEKINFKDYADSSALANNNYFSIHFDLTAYNAMNLKKL